MNWQIVPNGEAAGSWDEQLIGAEDYTVFQSFGWGEFKRREGWQPCRVVGHGPQGRVAAMMQLLTKTLPFGFAVGWAPGGPAMLFGSKATISKLICLDCFPSFKPTRREFLSGSTAIFRSSPEWWTNLAPYADVPARG